MQQLWLYWAGDADKMHWLHLMNERDWLKWCQVLPWQNNLRYYVLVAGMFCCVGSIISCSIQSSDKSVFWILIMKISTKVSWYSLAKSSLPAKSGLWMLCCRWLILPWLNSVRADEWPGDLWSPVLSPASTGCSTNSSTHIHSGNIFI